MGKTTSKKAPAKKAVAKKPVAKAAVKKNEDLVAFERLLETNANFKHSVRSTGKARMFAVFQAGIKRGQSKK